MRCETLSDKDAWLEVLNRTASMQREREEKEQRSREQREREQRQQVGTSSSANQRNATTSENSEKRPVTRFNHHHREFQKMDTRTEVRKVKDWREIEERAEIILRERMANDINGISSARRSGRL